MPIRASLRRRADEVSTFVAEQEALARARAAIRDVDERRGRPTTTTDASEELADHTAAYRELTRLGA
nr:hypothetical protein GCM10020063_009500 [Dactylosporangium thailandense]